MAELARKKKVRAGHRASTTRILGQIDPAVATEPLEVPKITQLRRSLEDKLASLTALDDEILPLLDEEAIEAEIIQTDEIKEHVYAALSKLEVALKPGTTPTCTADRTPEMTSELPETSRETEGALPTTRGARVKLPKISLPRFGGDPVKWTTFWDSYQSAIHGNDSLSDVDKFNYLRSLLDHTALEAIAGLTLSTANYQQAIEILCKRFGNKQVIVSKLMDTLMSMDPIPSDRHLRDLRKLYDHIESHVRSLQSLGIEATSYGALLSPVLLSKLPPDLRLIVSRKVSDTDLDVDALLTTYEEELTARERANPKQTRCNVDRPRQTASAFLSASQNVKPDPRCCYCEQSHSSSSCPTVTTLVDRKHILKTHGRCYNCLRKNHLSRSCKSTARCLKCRRKHHTSICDAGPGQASMTQHSDQTSETAHTNLTELNPSTTSFESTTTTRTHTTLCSDQVPTVFLQTARAVIHHPSNPRKSLEVRLILDGGSQKSYLSERARDLLKLEVTGRQSLAIATFGSNKGSEKVCPIVSASVCLRGYPSMPLTLYVMPTICEPLVGQPTAVCVKQYPHLMGLELADSVESGSSMPVDVLIGADYYWHLVTGSICRGAEGPIAVHTKLGWVLSGPSHLATPEQCAMNLSVTHVLHAEIHSVDTHILDCQLRSFWELEALGIQDEEKTLYDDFIGSVEFQEGRYKVPLPWKEYHAPLSDNYQLSVNRLQGLLRRLRQEPSVLKEYDRIIQDQLEKGIVEPAQLNKNTQGATHYLPHHAVVRQDKTTTKVRIVYDASAKSGNSPSLNDCLLKGPKFNQLIFDLLVRFRSYKIALIADLEKAFLMVVVDEADRDVLRFIWVDDPLKDTPELKVYRFTRVVFGVSSSPFLLNATIRFHLEKYLETDKSLVQQLLHSTYVDDIVAGGQTAEEAFALYTRSKEIFREGGFNLRKFQTNSVSLQAQINLKEGLEGSIPLQLDEPTYAETTLGTSQPTKVEEHKVLGVPWNPESDRLIFDVTAIAKLALDLRPTKRNVVSLVGKFYDPLGFLSPVIIKFKILFQKLCQSKIDWDELIPEELVGEWNRLISDLNLATPVSIDRSFLSEINDPLTSATLYGFCDASIKAYAAVVYLVLKTDIQNVVHFVAAKTRVAPLQVQSVPRLELLSALLLSRLIVSVYRSLQHQMATLDMRCYTDSQVSLYWVRGRDKEWRPFVQNRVREIRRDVQPELWFHCPGVINPADLPSRGLSMVELAVNQLWRAGPEWLGFDMPVHSESTMPEPCSQELKLTSKKSHTLLAAEKTPTVGDLVHCEEYSDLQRLLRVTAYVLRAVYCFKKVSARPSDTVHSSLSLQEIASAERLWIAHSQQELVCQKDYNALKKQLGLFQDEKGLWRCGGRLQNADISYTSKHPILLPRSHPFTALIVHDAHRRVFHNGVKETLTEVRSKYWIVKGRSLTRTVIHRCIICKRFEGAPFNGPPPPPLPDFRVREDPAFTYTGVDFAGPLSVRNELSTSTSKAWICVFTCLVTRGIHLDLVCDLSTDTFLRCLKRFTARRGLPRKFLSDNGKTFKAAARLLNTILKEGTVQEYLNTRGSQWIFNVERAPWWGGVFERMVRSTKRCLRKVVGRAHLTRDELLTTVVEIEAVINSRPLSYVSATDCEEPLTPSHLIMGRRILSLPDHLGYVNEEPDDEDFEVNTSQLTRRMKHLAGILNHFWKRWKSEYLSELRESHSYVAKKTSRPTHVNEGDVVIVHDETLPRGLWKLGRIQELFTGSDNLPRSALVRVATRDRQHIYLRRPLQQLYPLEIHGERPLPKSPAVDVTTSEDVSTPEPEPEAPTGPSIDPEDMPEPSTPERRPVRAAAKAGAQKRRAWIRELQGQD